VIGSGGGSAIFCSPFYSYPTAEVPISNKLIITSTARPFDLTTSRGRDFLSYNKGWKECNYILERRDNEEK